LLIQLAAFLDGSDTGIGGKENAEWINILLLKFYYRKNARKLPVDPKSQPVLLPPFVFK